MDPYQRMLLAGQYEALLKVARQHVSLDVPYQEIVVVKTASGMQFFLEIPDFTDAKLREPLENEFLRKLSDLGQHRVLYCLVLLGEHPDIPSWNLRTGLIALHPDNLQTQTFLWGGGEDICVRAFWELLPPPKRSK